LTSRLNIDVSKLSDRDIARICRQWLKGKPVAEISRDFQVTRQRIYQPINQFKQDQTFPELRRPGRKPEPIDPETEQIVLESYFEYNPGPVHLEKKIEEIHGNHIPHNRICRVLLSHGLVEVKKKKRQQGKYVRYERAHSMSMWQGDGKEFEIDGTKRRVVAFIDDSSRLGHLLRRL
jgi:putative transposase